MGWLFTCRVTNAVDSCLRRNDGVHSLGALGYVIPAKAGIHGTDKPGTPTVSAKTTDSSQSLSAPQYVIPAKAGIQKEVTLSPLELLIKTYTYLIIINPLRIVFLDQPYFVVSFPFLKTFLGTYCVSN